MVTTLTSTIKTNKACVAGRGRAALRAVHPDASTTLRDHPSGQSDHDEHGERNRDGQHERIVAVPGGTDSDHPGRHHPPVPDGHERGLDDLLLQLLDPGQFGGGLGARDSLPRIGVFASHP